MSRYQLRLLLVVFLILPLVRPITSRASLDAVVRVKATIPEDARTAASLGTEREGNGIVIDRKGHVLTIGYLILEAARITVTAADGQTYSARFVGYDHGTGFGILKTAPAIPAEPIALGDSNQVALGDSVQVLSAGELAGIEARVISRKAFTGYWEYLLESAIYVVPAHPEYGGAALVAADGRLVGVGSILTRMEFEELGWVPCNMFVPIDLLKPILTNLIEGGSADGPSKPWLGIHSDEIQGRVFVIRVSNDGPASAAGVKTGDIVLAVGGETVEGLADFYRKVWALGQAGTRIPLRILQGDQVREIVIQSRDRRSYLRPAANSVGEPI